MIDKLVDSLDVYSEYDRQKYQKLLFQEVETVTDKAALIDGQWIPKSQLKCGVDKDLYITKWMYDKLVKQYL